MFQACSRGGRVRLLSFFLIQGCRSRSGGGLVDTSSWLSKEQDIPTSMVTVNPIKGYNWSDIWYRFRKGLKENEN